MTGKAASAAAGPHLVGAGTLTDMNLSDGYVFDGTRPRKHSAVAVVLPTAITAETTILHGCVPVSSFMTITNIDGAEVFELDGRPALDVIETMLGIDVADDDGRNLSLMVTLGEKHGDPFADYDENRYVNRLILRVASDRRSITLFEPDFRRGSVVQIMSRDNGLMVQSVRERRAVDEQAGIRPAGADGAVHRLRGPGERPQRIGDRGGGSAARRDRDTGAAAWVSIPVWRSRRSMRCGAGRSTGQAC